MDTVARPGGGTGGLCTWGTDGLCAWGTDGLYAWGTDGSSARGNVGLCSWGTDGLCARGTDVLCSQGLPVTSLLYHCPLAGRRPGGRLWRSSPLGCARAFCSGHSLGPWMQLRLGAGSADAGHRSQGCGPGTLGWRLTPLGLGCGVPVGYARLVPYPAGPLGCGPDSLDCSLAAPRCASLPTFATRLNGPVPDIGWPGWWLCVRKRDSVT